MEPQKHSILFSQKIHPNLPIFFAFRGGLKVVGIGFWMVGSLEAYKNMVKRLERRKIGGCWWFGACWTWIFGDLVAFGDAYI